MLKADLVPTLLFAAMTALILTLVRGRQIADLLDMFG
jgi:hypothetical protein